MRFNGLEPIADSAELDVLPEWIDYANSLPAEQLPNDASRLIRSANIVVSLRKALNEGRWTDVEQIIDSTEEDGSFSADLDECILGEVTAASRVAEHRLAAHHLSDALASDISLEIDWNAADFPDDFHSFPPLSRVPDTSLILEAISVADELHCTMDEVLQPVSLAQAFVNLLGTVHVGSGADIIARLREIDSIGK